MTTKTIEMVLSKSTKGTHVYSYSGGDQAIGSLYIAKAALPDKPPEKITVVVNYD